MRSKRHAVLLGLIGLSLAALLSVKVYANRSNAAVFRARFINETGTDIILVLESPEPNVGLTLNLEDGKKSNVINIRGGHRPLMAWDDTTLELVTLTPLVVDRNMRVHVKKTSLAPVALHGDGGPVEPTDNP